MIYVTGDMHGDIRRFKSKAMRKLKKNDTLLVCGDFGFLWDGSKKEKRLLKWIGKRKYQVLFIEGTHDNLDLLEQYPAQEWCGGQARVISGRLRHLCRGGVFAVEDKTLFVFGGGESVDTDSRIGANTWWSAEMPSFEEIERARNALAAHNDRVDYIFTHQCSRKIKEFLNLENNEANIMDIFFDQVREHCAFERWYFAGYHINKAMPASHMTLFDAVVPVTADRI